MQLSQISCLNNAQNTGVDACFLDPKRIVGIILTPRNYQVAAAIITTGLAGVLTQLQADINNTSKSARIYPVNGFETGSDSSEALVVQTMSYGGKHVVREGMLDWGYQFVNGGLSLSKKLRSFNGTGHDFFLIDSDNNLIGTSGTDATGSPCLQAISISNGFFWCIPWKVNEGTKIAEYAVRIVFQPQFINDLVQFIAFGASYNLPTLLTGLQSIILTSPSANATAGSYNIVPYTQDSKTNLYDTLDTELVAASWVATNDAGLPIAITSVTPGAAVGGAGIGGYVIALSTADPNYPTVAGKKVTINFASPSVLTTNGTPGLEGIPVSIVHN